MNTTGRYLAWVQRPVAAAVLVAAAITLAACHSAPKYRAHTFDGNTMGTTYTVKVVCRADNAFIADLPGRIQRLLDDINLKMSTYRPDSELSKFNQYHDPEPFPISKENRDVFSIALQVSTQSKGAFDVTAAPLFYAWGFGPEKKDQPPTDDALNALREHVGFQYLDLRPQGMAKKKPNVICDFSAVAPGYAVDQIVLLLQQSDIENYMVELGGEVRARGKNHNGKSWRIGIERPLADKHQIQKVVKLSGQALATSGDYREFFVKDGVRYSHTIDPKTGKPIAHRLASVSVVHDSCAFADAYATAIMVMGPDAGYEFAIQQHLPAYFIVHNEEEGFTEKQTPDFKSFCLP